MKMKNNMDLTYTKRCELNFTIGEGETIARAIEILQEALKKAEEMGAVHTSFVITRGSDGYVELAARIPKTEEEIAADRARKLEWKKFQEARAREQYEKLRAKFEKKMSAKIYIHEGTRHYIGSTVIVIAKSKKEATVLIKEQLDNMGLREEPIDIVETKNIEMNSIVYSNDGYY